MKNNKEGRIRYFYKNLNLGGVTITELRKSGEGIEEFAFT